MSGNRFIRNVLVTLGALVCAAIATGSATAAPQEIVVLSNRADLISGGDALVEIKWPARTNLAATLVSLNGVSIRPAFDMRANGRFIGLVRGLKNGNNVLLARDSAGAAQITITNYPIGGPVFSGGQQLAPWICAMKAVTAVPVTAPNDPTLTGTTNTKASGLSSDQLIKPPTQSGCLGSKRTYCNSTSQSFISTTASANAGSRAWT